MEDSGESTESEHSPETSPSNPREDGTKEEVELTEDNKEKKKKLNLSRRVSTKLAHALRLDKTKKNQKKRKKKKKYGP